MNTETFTCFCPPGSTCCNDIDYCTDDPCCNGATCSSNNDLLSFECFVPHNYGDRSSEVGIEPSPNAY